jgi:hypothetical protein
MDNSDSGDREITPTGYSRPGGVERRGQPFVPDPHRVVYPVDHATSQRHAREKFEAEIRIVVGGQLTRRIVDEACGLEDEIRGHVHDAAEYSAVSVVLSTFLADAINVRHEYMHPDDRPGYGR